MFPSRSLFSITFLILLFRNDILILSLITHIFGIVLNFIILFYTHPSKDKNIEHWWINFERIHNKIEKNAGLGTHFSLHIMATYPFNIANMSCSAFLTWEYVQRKPSVWHMTCIHTKNHERCPSTSISQQFLCSFVLLVMEIMILLFLYFGI